MAKKLGTTVHVNGEVYGPGDKLPADVRKLLADNPRVWSDEEDEAAEAEIAETHPGPSETSERGEAVQEAIAEGQRARDAEHAAAVEAAGLADEAPAARRRSSRQ